MKAMLYINTIDLLKLNPVNETVDAVDKIAKTATDNGLSTVMASLMVVLFIITIIRDYRRSSNIDAKLVKVETDTNNKLLESQKKIEDYNEQIIKQNEVIQDLLNKIVDSKNKEALLEQTSWNVEKIVSASFDRNLIEILRGVSELILTGNLEDEKFIKTQVESLVMFAHTDRLKWLSSFTHDGKELGLIADSNTWIAKKVSIIEDFISSEDKSYHSLIKNLVDAYRVFSQELNL